MASHTSSKEARNKAVSKYVKENYDTILLRFTKESGDKQLISEHSKKMNETITGFIKRAIRQTIENDNKKTQS